MQKNNCANLPGGCRVVALPNVLDDRGMLTFAEGNNHVPFLIKRIFWIQDVPVGKYRGAHSHKTCQEMVVAVTGGFTMYIDDGHENAEVRLDSPTKGIVIEAGVWCELRDFLPGTVLFVAASEEFDPSGYVHNYDEYLEDIR